MRERNLYRSLLAHLRDVLAEDADGAGVRSKQAIGKFHQDGLAATSGAKEDAGFATLDSKGDVLEHRFDVEDDGDVFKDNYRLGGILTGLLELRGGRVFWHGRAHLPKIPIIARLTMKSTMMMKTDETTTAWVVALPTP